MKTLIVEDESGPRNALLAQINTYCPQLTVVAEAGTVAEAVEAIRVHNPALVFMDVRLPDGTAFDILNQVVGAQFQVVFVTAHDEFAVEAFKYHAAHYILKPILPDDLLAAVNRIKNSPSALNDIHDMLRVVHEEVHGIKVAIPSVSKINYVNANSIIRCESEGSYTHIYTEDEDHLLSTKPLKEFDDQLSEHGFFRVHRSFLINLRKVAQYQRNSADSVIMNDGSRVEVSRKQRTAFLEAMSNL